MNSTEVYLEITVQRIRQRECRHDTELFELQLAHFRNLWELYKKKEKEEGIDNDLTLENAYLSAQQKRLKNRKCRLVQIRGKLITRWA